MSKRNSCTWLCTLPAHGLRLPACPPARLPVLLPGCPPGGPQSSAHEPTLCSVPSCRPASLSTGKLEMTFYLPTGLTSDPCPPAASCTPGGWAGGVVAGQAHGWASGWVGGRAGRWVGRHVAPVCSVGHGLPSWWACPHLHLPPISDGLSYLAGARLPLPVLSAAA
jgi:hypothetical protein